MQSYQIQGLIKLAGYRKLKELAADLEVSEPAISQVLNRKIVSRRLMKHIAGVICLPPEIVFPEKAHIFKKNTISQPEPQANTG